MFSILNFATTILVFKFNNESLGKFPRLNRTVDLVDWKNLPDRPQFHQTDTLSEKATKK